MCLKSDECILLFFHRKVSMHGGLCSEAWNGGPCIYTLGEKDLVWKQCASLFCQLTGVDCHSSSTLILIVCMRTTISDTVEGSTST